MERFQWINIVYLIGVLVLVAPAAIMLNRRRGTAVANIAIWLGIATAIAALYWFFEPG